MGDPRALVTLVLVFVYAIFSERLGRFWISMPMAMVSLGYVLGPAGLGVWELDLHSELVRTAAELTLALMLFHDAVRIDLRALRVGYRIPLRLLGIGLPVMLVLGTAGAAVMLPAVSLATAALLSTMLAPTDAALGEAVVSDKRVPVSIRQGLNVESGLNDGLSVPVFLVLLAICADPAGWAQGALAIELARQIGLGVLGALLVGGIGGFGFRFAVKRKTIAAAWRRIAILLIAVGCFVCAAVLGGSGFIGAFMGGVFFGLTSEARSQRDNLLTEQVGTIFDAFSFLLVGAMLLPVALAEATPSIVGYAVLSLTVFRLASVVLAMLGSGASWPTLGFMGWFGPRGLATVVFTVMVVDSGIPHSETVVATAVIGIVLSVFAHGLSAPPLVSAYSAWWNRTATQRTGSIEAEQVPEHGVRLAPVRAE